MSHFSEYFRARYGRKKVSSFNSPRPNERFFIRESPVRVTKSDTPDKIIQKEVSKYLIHLVDLHKISVTKDKPNQFFTESIFKLYIIVLIVEILSILIGIIHHQQILFKTLLLGSLFYLEKTYLTEFSFLILVFIFYFI
jgi:hypothetical protein